MHANFHQYIEALFDPKGNKALFLFFFIKIKGKFYMVSLLRIRSLRDIKYWIWMST